MQHLTLERILELALSGEHDPHLDACAFCRSELENAREFDAFLEEGIVEEPAIERPHRVYRMAAQTPHPEAASITRRTWYLESCDVVVRVIEDVHNRLLTGHVIADPTLYPRLAIRFSGLPGEFHPDLSGSFVIGAADLDIDPMEIDLTIAEPTRSTPPPLPPSPSHSA